MVGHYHHLYKKRDSETGEVYKIFVYIMIGTEKEEAAYLKLLRRMEIPIKTTKEAAYYKDEHDDWFTCVWGDHPTYHSTVFLGKQFEWKAKEGV